MKNDILIKVLIAIMLALIAGSLTEDQAFFNIPYVHIYQLIGQLFLNALHLVAVPLVCASIILGTARMGAEASFGFLGVKTFSFYLLTSALAVGVGVCGFIFFFSEMSIQENTSITIVKNEIVSAIQPSDHPSDAITQILLKLVPSNIVLAASQGQMLGLIFFSILFGFFISKIDHDVAPIMLGFWKGIFQIMMKITHFIMKALPIGVFGLVAKVIATAGFEAIASAGIYFITVITSMILYSFAIIPILLAGAGVNPVRHFFAMSPALFTAFCTSSSAATLPITMECIEKRVGVSNRISHFTIPLGTSLNMSGGALCMCVASLFIAHAYHFPLNMTTITLVAFMALLTSMGIAGIPSASLISVALILQTIGVPAEGIGLIIAVDRILDMCRTTINVLSNSVCAVLLARSEQEEVGYAIKTYSL